MLQYLGSHFKNIRFQRHETESFSFYLNYRITCIILMACCIAVTSNLFAGEPIVCTQSTEVSNEVMTSYCWSHSTYSIRSSFQKTVGKEVPYPGIDTSEKESDAIYRDYYQWVYLVLLIQGIFFYMPHGVWKAWESGKMQQLGEKLADPPPMYSTTIEEDLDRSAKMSHEDKLYAAAFFFCKRLGLHEKYAFGYWFCEILSWLNIILQTMFLDTFFQGEFVPLGTRAIAYFRAGQIYDNPLTWIFPRMAKCHFHKFGPTGKVDTIDVICVLPINALSEKIYLFLWFWYVFIFALSSIGMIKTILTIMIPKMRGLRLSLIETRILCRKSGELGREAREVGSRCSFGDWYVLTILAKRMEELDFTLFLSDIRQEMFAMRKKKRNFFSIHETDSTDV